MSLRGHRGGGKKEVYIYIYSVEMWKFGSVEVGEVSTGPTRTASLSLIEPPPSHRRRGQSGVIRSCSRSSKETWDVTPKR